MQTNATKVRETGEGRMVRGTIVSLRRRCGKAQCRCADGEPHESWVLSYSLKGRTHMVPVQDEALSTLRRELSRYRAKLAALERQALNGIAYWRRRRT
jgi:hypothetical protein